MKDSNTQAVINHYHDCCEQHARAFAYAEQVAGDSEDLDEALGALSTLLHHTARLQRASQAVALILDVCNNSETTVGEEILHLDTLVGFVDDSYSLLCEEDPGTKAHEAMQNQLEEDIANAHGFSRRLAVRHG